MHPIPFLVLVAALCPFNLFLMHTFTLLLIHFLLFLDHFLSFVPIFTPFCCVLATFVTIYTPILLILAVVPLFTAQFAALTKAVFNNMSL